MSVRWGSVRVADRSAGIVCLILAKYKVYIRRSDMRSEIAAEMQA
jgi:hypothetical protein